MIINEMLGRIYREVH